LLVAVWIGVGLVLVTAVLMYYLRPRDEDNPQFKSLPATIYLSTLMLTGQGGPDGALPWYTSTVVLLTGIFSIGMFAIPASMLTWGFEGEAERIAKLRRQKLVAKHNCVIKNRSNRNENMNDNWSYSSEDYSTDEEYLNTIAGFEVSDDDDKEEEREGKRNFRLADIDRSGTLSLTEFLKLSRELKRNEDIQIENIALANILESLFRKVDDNSKKLELICSRLGCTSSAVNCTDA
jgi:hypothetical protein